MFKIGPKKNFRAARSKKRHPKKFFRAAREKQKLCLFWDPLRRGGLSISLFKHPRKISLFLENFEIKGGTVRLWKCFTERHSLGISYMVLGYI